MLEERPGDEVRGSTSLTVNASPRFSVPHDATASHRESRSPDPAWDRSHASLKHGRRDGWRSKAALIGDFAARPDDASLAKGTRALENLRAELSTGDLPGLTDGEIDAIIKVERGTGKIRLGVPPENITFEGSLASIEWKLPVVVGKGRAPSSAQEEGLARAGALLAGTRRLGVGPPP